MAVTQQFANSVVLTHFSYSIGHFFQSILANRYFHHRELLLISLESPYSVCNYFFLNFDFSRQLSRFKNFVNNGIISVVFVHILRNLCAI